MVTRDDEQMMNVDPLVIGDEVWDFYHDVASNCYVARRRGDDDKPIVGARYEWLREKVKELREAT